VAVAEEGLELAQLAGIPRVTAWARSAPSGALLAAGDVGGATREAGEARAIGAAGGFHAAGQPAWCEGNALAAAGNAERAVPRLEEALRAALPVQRPLVAADLAEARLAGGDAEAAASALADGAGARAGGDGARAVWPAAVTGAARAAVLLARGQAAQAAALAAAARGGAPR
jgi:hypothetical protein